MKKLTAITISVLIALISFTGVYAYSEGNQTDIFADMDIRPDILSAIRASRKLSGYRFNLASDNGFYFEAGNRNYAYAYFNEPVIGLFADADGGQILALMEDGRVFNGTTLISADANIWDVRWKTHQTNIDAYMLGRNGQAYFYNPYNSNEWMALPIEVPFSAIARSGSFPLFFGKDGGIFWPNISMSGGSAKVASKHIDYWKDVRNIVVAACLADDNGNFSSIAGIATDGTVYASGEYADEILTWGELIYIVADTETNLFVGLTPDHEIRLAGHNREKVNIGNLEPVGLCAMYENLWAIDENGDIYMDYLSGLEGVERFTPEGTDYWSWRMDSEGRLYLAARESAVNESGLTVFEATADVSANFGDHESMIYYLELIKGEINFSSEYDSWSMPLDEDTQLALIDLDGDNAQDIIMTGTEYDAIGSICNGRLTCFVCGLPVKYDPQSGVFVSGNPAKLGYAYDYCQWKSDSLNSIAREFIDDDTGESRFVLLGNYTIWDLPEQDAEGKEVRSELGGDFYLSRGEFEKLIDSVLQGHDLQSVELSWFNADRASISDMLFNGTSPDEALKAERGSAGASSIDWETVNTGDIVEFGSWEQDNIDNGPEPIKWYVAEINNGAALLLCKDIIDGKPYFTDEVRFLDELGPVINNKGLVEKRINTSKRGEMWETHLIVTWEKSDLREWLNGEFYDRAFTDIEKARVMQMQISTPPDENRHNGCPDTLDHVFIPTYGEIDDDYLFARLTPYAHEQVWNNYFAMYWLRSNRDELMEGKGVVYYNCDSHHVDEDSSSDLLGMDNNNGVRPAIWVSLENHPMLEQENTGIQNDAAPNSETVVEEEQASAPVFTGQENAGVIEPTAEFYYCDEVGVLTADVADEIFYSSQALYKSCGAQIVVAVINTTGDIDIHDYSNELFNKWGIGDKTRKNGFLLLLAIEDDEYYAVTGIGLGEYLKPEMLKAMFNNHFEPDFAAKQYSTGVKKIYEKVFDFIALCYGSDVTISSSLATLQQQESPLPPDIKDQGNTASGEKEERKKWYCPNCGTENKKNFCYKCGTPNPRNKLQ